jgi:hypothetical protein
MTIREHGDVMNQERHLMPAEMTDPELIRVVLAELPVAGGIATPPDIVAITRRRVVEAGLDTLAVTRWLQPLGGYGAVAYMRPATHRHATDPVRPALHPVSYFAVPVDALSPPAASADDGEDTAAGTAVA